ncbi:MAG: tRNA (adenosine(37)-N6)-dimethylallyltransferase MiaA [Akkermansia sp.]
MDLRPLFILGPTGSGKSSIAIAVAESLISAGQAVEIVSADAYQIYKDLPILTAAPSAEDLARVRHHLVHEIELEQNHDAGAHARMALARMEEMRGRGVKAIVTGGSGLYVKFISHGISEAPPSSEELRAELEEWTSERLIAEFQRIDAEGLAMTAVENRRYLVRNLEIVMLSKKPLRYWRQNWGEEAAGMGWGIERSVEELDERIYRRAGEMYEMGLLEEVRGIEGRELSETAGKVLGLEVVRERLRGEILGDESVRKLGLMTRQYAKRQRTWLRRESWVRRVGASEAVERIVAAELGEKKAELLKGTLQN